MYRGFRFEVHGKVQGKTESRLLWDLQGVFFRKSTKQEADRLGIVGWVMNTPYKTVVGEAQGLEAPMDQLQDSMSLFPLIL